MADFLITVAEALASTLPEFEGPDLISFGAETFAELKHQILPKHFDYFSPECMYGIKYEVEDRIPFGEFRLKKWVTENGELKLRVYKTVQSPLPTKR